MKILIADDDRMTVLMIARKLKEKGHTILMAEDGSKALNIIESQQPDLIISDVMMPGLCGLTLLNLLKQFYFNKVPLILISSLNQVSIISRSLSLGAYDFIVKPINFEELFRIIAGITKASKG